VKEVCLFLGWDLHGGRIRRKANTLIAIRVT
jgi:hypothetical protein